MDVELYETFNLVEQKHWWFVARRKYLQSYLSHYVPTDGSLQLAEIGAGTGGNFGLISQFGELDAIEMDSNAINFAQKKAGEIINVKSVAAGWLPDNIPLIRQYDGVFALDVIEHVEDDKAAVNRLIELVKPSGYLLITVPAYQWLWSEHDEMNHHFRRYTCKQLGSLFNNTQMNLLNIGYFNTLLFPLAVVRRITQKLSRGNNGQHSDLDLPSPLMNGLLKTVFLLESYWAGKISMPFGLSAITLLQKNG